MLLFLIAVTLAAGYDAVYFVRAVKRKTHGTAAACLFLLLLLAMCFWGILTNL